MLMIDLLSDFCELKGLSCKYLGKYYRIISEFFISDVKNNKNNANIITFSKMASILIGYEDIWIQIFKICQTLADDGQDLNVESPSKAASRDVLRRYV